MNGNRKPNKAHVRKLQDAISANAKLSQFRPILVNENYEIIDGQHRYEALKNLDQPIHYVVAPGTGLKEVQELNSIAKVWTPIEYAKSYADLGQSDYRFYLEMREAYGLNHDVLLSYISLDEPMTGEMYKDGKLFAPDRDLSHLLARRLTEVGQYYPRYKIRSFALAFKAVFETPEYDHSRMLSKIKQEKVAEKYLKNYSLREEYIRALENLYNHNQPTHTKVRFDFN